MMFTDHECAVEEAHFLQETHKQEVYIVTNDRNFWVLSTKQFKLKQYAKMRILEKFSPGGNHGQSNQDN
tara:strand:- start:310 stop:516 length:207 start_codon:yes stop_codon:yes gene_type:complete